jgi:hypothetical protein
VSSFEVNPSIGKPHPYWFTICGFNITILAGLSTKVFSRLLGRWRGALATGTSQIG